MESICKKYCPAASSSLEARYLLWLYLWINILSSLLCLHYLLNWKLMLPTISRKIRMHQRSCKSPFVCWRPTVMSGSCFLGVNEWRESICIYSQAGGKMLNSSSSLPVSTKLAWSGDLHKSSMRAVNYSGHFPAQFHLFCYSSWFPSGCSSSYSASRFCYRSHPSFPCVLSSLQAGVCVLDLSFWTDPCRLAGVQTGTECLWFSCVLK